MSAVYKVTPSFGSGNTFLGSSQSVVVTSGGSLGVGTPNPVGSFEVSSSVQNSGTSVRISSLTSAAPSVCRD
jgi:hypothetical protein